MSFRLGSKMVGDGYPPLVIAELSANHGGKIELAKDAIEAAKKSGAHAVKLQTYTADSLTIDSSKKDFLIEDGLWAGYSLYQLYQEAATPLEWHFPLFEYAKKIGITIFSSPFDQNALALLENLDCPAYKIASFELVDLDLIRQVAECKKPLFMSTGMASLDEIGDAVEVAKQHGVGNILLFHCISTYPADVEDCNLANINVLKEEFKVEVGLSDHTTTNMAAIIAVSLGASAIEKHFKPSSKLKSADADFSLTPSELRSLCADCESAWGALGRGGFKRPDSERASLQYRRSIYFVTDLRAGEYISPEHVRVIRPGFGVPPRFLSDIYGKKVLYDVERGDPVTFDSVDWSRSV